LARASATGVASGVSGWAQVFILVEGVFCELFDDGAGGLLCLPIVSILLNTYSSAQNIIQLFQYASYKRNDEENLVAIDSDVVINHHLMWCHVDDVS
jgi:hypothetical protein